MYSHKLRRRSAIKITSFKKIQEIQTSGQVFTKIEHLQVVHYRDTKNFC